MIESFSFLGDIEDAALHGNAELVVSAGANRGYTVPVREELWIGRDPTCGLQLFDEVVSGRHCLIRREGELYTLEDNGSRNGTFLNGKRVTSHILYHRDEISCGGAALKFLCPSCPNPRKTTVQAFPAFAPPPVEKIETPAEAEGIEAALVQESRKHESGTGFSAPMIAGYRLLQTIAEQTDWQEMFRKLLDGLPSLVPHDTAVVCRYNAKTHNALPVMHRRPEAQGDAPRIEIDQDLLGRCCAERRCIAHRRESGRWALAAPMSGYDRILGVLYLETPALPDPRLALAIIAGVCRNAGMVLLQSELLNAIRQQKLQLESSARAIAQEKSKLDSLVSALIDGIALVTPAGEVLSANPSARRCLETLCRFGEQGRLAEVGGVAWNDLAAGCTPDHAPPPRELRDERGERRYETLLGYVPLGRPGDPGTEAPAEHGYALLFRDVTELRANEEALRKVQKLEAVGTLAGGLAHEFNNILATISTEAAGALEFADRDYAIESLRNIQEAAGTASAITRDLLNFAKPQEPVREPVDLAELLGRALHFVKQDLRNLRVEVVQDFRPVPPVIVDSRQIQQVFVNVLTNARDAMPDGGTLTLSLARNDGFVEVGFADTGTGIRPEHLQRIFDPFFTSKGAYGRSRIPGTGLGLSVALGIVRRHGGAIDVTSTPGVGTRVVVRLPVATPDGGAA